jgi:chromosome segregation protein
LLAEVISVEAGFERAAAAALGPLAQAVVLGASNELQLVLDGDDVLEAVVTNGEQGSETPGGPTPAGTRDFWEVVGGPAEIIGSLRTLLPPTAIVIDDVRLGLTDVTASRGYYRLVNRRGEILHAGVHVARRRELGAETLLQVRNELEGAAAERLALLKARDQAGMVAGEAAAELERAEALVREAQEELNVAERTLARAGTEGDLAGRRLAEAGLEQAELSARQERDGGLAAQMAVELQQVEEKIAGCQTGGRGACGVARIAESMTDYDQCGGARGEEEPGGLGGGAVAERCRGRDGERNRVASQRDMALAAAER